MSTNTRTSKLLQHAGKYVTMGKFALALEQYLKIHGVEPEDTTIINTIADLYLRLGEKDNALAWYFKLAEIFEFRELSSNAAATYRKILKLSPKSHDAIGLLAQLYERIGQGHDAALQYRLLAKFKMDLHQEAAALEILQKVTKLDPKCIDSLLTLAKLKEDFGSREEALPIYLKAATVLIQKGDVDGASQAVSNIFRLQPKQKQFLKDFLPLLRFLQMGEQAYRYVESLSFDDDPELRAILCEMLLEQGKMTWALRLIQGQLLNFPILYNLGLKALQILVKTRNLDTGIRLVVELYRASIHFNRDPFGTSWQSMIPIEEEQIRPLRAPLTALLSMSEDDKLEECLKSLAALQLRSEFIDEGLKTLNELTLLPKAEPYLELTQVMNETCLVTPIRALRNDAAKIIRALETNHFEKTNHSEAAEQHVGACELNVGIAMDIDELEYYVGMPEP